MKINKVFHIKNFSKPHEIEWLKQEATRCLKKMEASQSEFQSKRAEPILSPDALEMYFRHHERSNKVRQILQYLIAFATHIPAEPEIEKEPTNPALQFREFICFQADLLLEKDVQNAACLASSFEPAMTNDTSLGYQERIIAINRELKQWIENSESSAVRLIANLCHVLEQICLFWFDIRNHDIRKTRRSDIYLYLFAQLVQNRCRQLSSS